MKIKTLEKAESEEKAESKESLKGIGISCF